MHASRQGAGEQGGGGGVKPTVLQEQVQLLQGQDRTYSMIRRQGRGGNKDGMRD